MSAAERWEWLPDGDAHVLTVTVPIKTVSEANSRDHWAKKARRTKPQRDTVGLVVRAALAGAGVTAPMTVTLVRCAPSSGLDDDNLASACKGVRDGVADALGIDDRDPRVTWRYAQERSRPGKYSVRIVIRRGPEGLT